ncbi:MAG TPA: hypothetical protein VGN54_08050 [Mycobacteriales bacterium]|jgi:hypothetical protein|nr:hypothetical protein [Mycobacteriales bacterium]
MTTIKATCPSCGEVDLSAEDVSLLVCATAPLSHYAFTCPSCHDRVQKAASDHVVSLLISGGVVPTTWDVPSEALEPHTGDPVSYDDLLDFGLWLGMSDNLAALAALPVAR